MADCVGCGYCCLRAMCSVGIREYGEDEGRCPYLVWLNDRYWCDLVLSKRINWRELATGFGCSSSLNDWRRDVKFRG